MLISANNSYQGLTMDRILAARTKGKKPTPDPLDELFDLLIEEGGSVSTVYDHHTEKDMNLAMAQPWCSIGSDGLAYATEGPLRRGHPHPRSFGTFPRVLGVYVRRLGLLQLEDAVRKMTSQNAVKLGLTDRGLLRPGAYADITLFDPERVIDRATYAEPFQYSEGIEYVIVNGQLCSSAASTPASGRGEHCGIRPRDNIGYEPHMAQAAYKNPAMGYGLWLVALELHFWRCATVGLRNTEGWMSNTGEIIRPRASRPVRPCPHAHAMKLTS